MGSLETAVHAGADVNAQDEHGRSPLMLAMPKIGYEDNIVLEVLLLAGSSLTLQDKQGVDTAMLMLENDVVSARERKRLLDCAVAGTMRLCVSEASKAIKESRTADFVSICANEGLAFKQWFLRLYASEVQKPMILRGHTFRVRVSRVTFFLDVLSCFSSSRALSSTGRRSLKAPLEVRFRVREPANMLDLDVHVRAERVA